MTLRLTAVWALLLQAACCFPASAFASHPLDPNARIVGSFHGTVFMPAAVSETHYEIIVWLLGSGEYDYQCDVGTLAFTGNDGCNGLNLVSLSDIADAVADDAIGRGVSLGYPSCGAPASGRRVRIWTSACAVRFGTGCNTTFLPCGPGWSFRRYIVKCPGIGVPDIAKEPGQAPECPGLPGCEASYDRINLN